jgi:glycosyltransferase involved in cell wall biosynthesis
MKNSKIKICHVANAVMAVKFLLLNQLKVLQKEGYEIYVVCSAGRFIEDIKKENIKVKIINFERGIKLFPHLTALIKLFFYFKREKFDIVHTHNPVPGFLGQIAAKMAGVPIIINTLHGFYFNEYTPFSERRFYIIIEKIAALCSDLILFQSDEDIKTALMEKICNPQKIKYLGNGTDLQKFNPERFSKEFIDRKKKELNINSNFKIIGVIGRLVKEKGYLDLFKALKEILKKFPDIMLLIIGPLEPGKKDAIDPLVFKEYGIEKNVLFLGQRDDVDELLSLIDIYVLPSWREGVPRSVLEASAMGKPTVTTNIRGCREAVDDGKTGILVPIRNPEKLTEAITYLFENPQIAREMGNNAREKAEKDFDENEVFNIITKKYRELIEKKL